MHVQIEIADGPQAGNRFDLTDGECLTVGRTAKSKCILSHDNYLSGLHFQIDVTAEGCVLHDANSSNGTFVNEQKVAAAVELQDGDRIVAGQTRFLVKMDADAAARGRSTLLMRQPEGTMLSGRETAPLDSTQRTLVDHLGNLAGMPLYALVDVTTDAALSVLVAELAHQHQPVAPGADRSPSLINLAGQPLLLPELLRACWGKSRMVLLTSNHPFESVRKHLRSFLLARTEDGRPFRLRLQDPRLLQIFLAGCSADEITNAFGPVDSFRMEDSSDTSRLLEFTVTPVGLRQNIVPLSSRPRQTAATA